VIAERLIDRVVDLRKMLFGLRRALLDKDAHERAGRGEPYTQRTQD
jgi:hypothetical protein